jgi:Sigma-70, region 4
MTHEHSSREMARVETTRLMGQADPSPSVLFGETEMDLWPYRRRTIALLRRYGRASVEVGRIPSLLGREFFRTRVSSYTMRNFEDVVIFVADMDRAIAKLSDLEKKLLGMNVLEEYTLPEVARLLGYTQRTVERSLQEALDQLSRILLRCGLMDELPNFTSSNPESSPKSCQGGKGFNFDVSDTNEAENKHRKVGGTPPSNLVS